MSRLTPLNWMCLREGVPLKRIALFASLWLSTGAHSFGQATIAVTCTSCTSGYTTVTANSFAATGVSAGGLTLPSGSAPSTAGVGLTPSAVTLFAPGTVTPYGIAPYGGASLASGFSFATLGSGATFGTVTVSSGVITAISGTMGVTAGGSGYATAPPCYFATTPAPTVAGTCSFTVTSGAISAVNFTGGTGYSGTVTVTAAPVLYLNYVPPSDSTNASTAYKVQTSSGTLMNTHIGVFNSTGDLTDSGVVYTNVPTLTGANSFTATNTFGAVGLNNTVTTYNSLSTAGIGVPPVLGVANQTGLSANLSSYTLYVTTASGAGSAGTYRVCLTAYVTATGSASAIIPNVVYNNGTASITRPLTSLSTLSTSNVSDGCVTLYSAASQHIGVDTTGYSGTGTYVVRATVEQLQ